MCRWLRRSPGCSEADGGRSRCPRFEGESAWRPGGLRASESAVAYQLHADHAHAFPLDLLHVAHDLGHVRDCVIVFRGPVIRVPL